VPSTLFLILAPYTYKLFSHFEAVVKKTAVIITCDQLLLLKVVVVVVMITWQCV
jgi:hypothetical protein